MDAHPDRGGARADGVGAAPRGDGRSRARGGIAGGLHPEVEIGDLVVPSLVVDRASGAEYFPSGLVADRAATAAVAACTRR